MKKLLKVQFSIDVAGVFFRYYISPWNYPYIPDIGHSVNLLSYISEQETKALKQIYFFSRQEGKKISFYNLLQDDFQVRVKNVNWNKDIIQIELYRKSIEIYELEMPEENFNDTLNGRTRKI
ncbi:hypothetical protein FACS189451_04070 [Bacteroidia bacterium]|nr:hypothetical protein FACS189446_1870 [Bacteroidia bacterium]GHT61625.1 hypothetical protein FACS189451_04070 [Bacteroidia bacterium]